MASFIALDRSIRYKEIGIPPNDAQFLETRKFQLNEICRIFRVPPHLIGDLERATFSNIEHQSIDFVVHTIRPWLVRWEQAIQRYLLSEGERAVYFAKFTVDALLRGDFKTRMDGYAVGRQNGWYSSNDVREFEDLNPIPEDMGGDLYLVNGNMMTATAAPIIEGHAAVFNQWSETLGGMFPFKEKVIPGAFRDSIGIYDIRALFNHDPN